ncbi:formylglycine-generating enzyme family protein [Rariglobus hedericola]|nr:SUMF1/EgtB/PvdO family nonheme iron enzyme [Rariglobus hedericola]
MRTSPLLTFSAALLTLGLTAHVQAAPLALAVESSVDEQTWVPVKITPGMISGNGTIIIPDAAVRLSIAPPTLPPAGMVAIPGGTFSMGEASNTDPESINFLHSVTLSAFNMDAREVSKALWDEVAAWGLTHNYTDLPAGDVKAPGHPVQTISWYAAVKWCNARSEKEGRNPAYKVSGAVYRTSDNAGVTCDWTANGYRLPTEAEWERAARGGYADKAYPWGTDSITQLLANYKIGSSTYHSSYSTGGFPYTSPTGVFVANAYGLYDMSGNVAEWCWDPFVTGYYGTTDAAGPDPKGPATGTNRVCRGGSWNGSSSEATTYLRRSNAPATTANTIGFRTVCR